MEYIAVSKVILDILQCRLYGIYYSADCNMGYITVQIVTNIGYIAVHILRLRGFAMCCHIYVVIVS